jgi:hypothetical protein
MGKQMNDAFWGEVIYTYDNDDAIQDGLFIDLRTCMHEYSPEVGEAFEGLLEAEVKDRMIITQGVMSYIRTNEALLSVLGALSAVLWDDGMKIAKGNGKTFWAFDEGDILKVILPEEY